MGGARSDRGRLNTSQRIQASSAAVRTGATAGHQDNGCSMLLPLRWPCGWHANAPEQSHTGH
eukprot:15455333-Alexandrium_andersonii.AAC.1